jgi:hypothetical protein
MSVFDYVRPEKTTMTGDVMSQNIKSRNASAGHLVTIIMLCAVLGACSPANFPPPDTADQMMGCDEIDAFFDPLIRDTDTREPIL